jgi:hypothetical protein
MLLTRIHCSNVKDSDGIIFRRKIVEAYLCVPSFYLDGRLPDNKTYGFNLFSCIVPCMAWLDRQVPCSVVLVSYDSQKWLCNILEHYYHFYWF